LLEKITFKKMLARVFNCRDRFRPFPAQDQSSNKPDV